jgi:hypothetical protein
VLLYEIDSLTSHVAHLHIQLWKYFNRLAFDFRDLRLIRSINFMSNVLNLYYVLLFQQGFTKSIGLGTNKAVVKLFLTINS